MKESKYTDWFQVFLENVYSTIAASAMGMLYLVAIIFSIGYAIVLGDTRIMQITLCVAMIALEFAGMAFWIKSLTANRRRVKGISFLAAFFLLFLSWFGVMTMIIASDSHKELIDNDKAVIKIDQEIESLTEQRQILVDSFKVDKKTKTKQSIEELNRDINRYQNRRELRARELPTASQIVFKKVEDLLPSNISEGMFYILIKGLWAVAILGTPVLLHLCSLMDTEKVKRSKGAPSPTAPSGGPSGGKKRTKKDEDTTERVSEKEILNAPQSAPVTAQKKEVHRTAPNRTAPSQKAGNTRDAAEVHFDDEEYNEIVGALDSGALSPSYRGLQKTVNGVKYIGSNDKAKAFLNRAANDGIVTVTIDGQGKKRYTLTPKAVRSGAVHPGETQKLKLVK